MLAADGQADPNGPRPATSRALRIITIDSAPTGSAVAKGGVAQLTQEVPREGARHGVRVNWVRPATILTEPTHRVIPAVWGAQLTAMHSAGRPGTSEERAHCGPVRR